ncbi:MAG: cysteine desulfurase [Proteobacteria bacterium]|nr:cysteine desulfurase [Pseudomonadota bacterium]MBT5064653.1 cysteine desulfurase [Pseudomonadota bacterium]MBT6192818.1 cysteine desulfurase [Pseudomonadota bacterium]MBT6465040.1 cysteine desulfurase [Pseudomonadota bacterium]MBT6673621.1 cysteine desulfurase [Pseudomonadota bacterium]
MSMAGNRNKEIGNNFDVKAIRDDFPILSRRINGKKLIYADNAATTQKPTSVIRRVSDYYEQENANIHRGVHSLSEEATEAFEAAREGVRKFLNADSVQEIIFTSGTTEAINLVAQSYARTKLKAGDEILISALEHHSNIVPWQMVCEQTGAQLKVGPINDDGEILMEQFASLITSNTKIIAIGHVSNALGTINDIKHIVSLGHAVNAVVLVDGAQASIHEYIDVTQIDCDFYAFSGHKALGPTGIGVLYGKAELLDEMPPWQGGGDMIKTVSFEKTEYNVLPYKFEAGTPNIAGGIGLGAALSYFSNLNLQAVMSHEKALLNLATERALAIPGLSIVGNASNKASVISFNIEGVHPQDLGTLLDHQGVAIRTGHHCAMPVMRRLGVSGTARVSFAFYNTLDEIKSIFDAIEKIIPMLRG